MPRKIATHRPAYLPDADRLYRDQDSRKEDNRFYKSAPWRALRAAFLAANPLCGDCLREGRTVAANTVHHVEERKLRPDRALDWDNLAALCPSCHNRQRKARGTL